MQYAHTYARGTAKNKKASSNKWLVVIFVLSVDYPLPACCCFVLDSD